MSSLSHEVNLRARRRGPWGGLSGDRNWCRNRRQFIQRVEIAERCRFIWVNVVPRSPRKGKGLSVGIQGLQLLAQIRVQATHCIEHRHFARAIPHGSIERYRLTEVFQGLLLLAEIRVQTADVAERQQLVCPVPYATVKRQRLLVIVQGLLLLAQTAVYIANAV